MPGRSILAVMAIAVTGFSCRAGEDIEKPQPRFSENAVEYPLELWDQNIEGNTLVGVLVNETGGVDSAMVMESSGHAGLDSAALRGALSMDFDPATKEGEPLRVWARVPVHFSKDADPVPPHGTQDRDGHVDSGSSGVNLNVTSGLEGLWTETLEHRGIQGGFPRPVADSDRG